MSEHKAEQGTDSKHAAIAFLPVSLRRILLPLGVIATFVVPPTYGQHEFRDRGDRYEGVESRRQVSGERLELIGAVIEHHQTARHDSNTVGFFLETDAEAEVNVRAFDQLYRMRPKDRSYRAGFSSFSWPTDITSDLGLSTADLFGLVLLAEEEPTRVAPIALSFETPPEPPVTYVFYFEANTRVDLTFRVRAPDSDSVIATAVLENQPIRQLIEFPWRVPDALAAGVYGLAVEATFHYRSKPSTTVNFAWRFYHGI